METSLKENAAIIPQRFHISFFKHRFHVQISRLPYKLATSILTGSKASMNDYDV